MVDEPRRVELVLARLEALPTLPTIASRLLEITSDDRFDLGEVSGLVEADAALTARVLALCRRAELGLGDRITTVRRAILMLGIDAVRSAVLSVCVFDLMSRESSRGGGSIDLGGAWTYALGVASAGEQIARAHPSMRLSPEEVFVAGLLHDIGRLALHVALPRAMGRVGELAASRGVDASAVERELIGMDHAVAGKRVSEHWGLPEALRRAVWLHEHESAALPMDEHRGLLLCLRCARALCGEMHVGESGDFGPGIDWRAEAEEIGVEVARVERVGKRLHADVAERSRALGVGDRQTQGLMLESIARANESLSRMVARAGRRRQREQRSHEAIDAIGRFLRDCDGGLDSRGVLGEIVRGASAWFEGEAWMTIEGGEDRVRAIAWPLEVDVGDVEVGAGGFEGVLDLLRERDVAELDLRTSDGVGAAIGRAGRMMRALRLSSADARVALVGDALPREIGGADETMVRVWAHALGSALRREGDGRLGEALAEANARIASMQADRTRVESMRRLGEMTAGAAHEMNNPLTTISGRAQRLAMRLEGEDRAWANAIVDSAHELSGLVRALHLLSETPRERRRPVDLAEVLGRAVQVGRERAQTLASIEVEAWGGLVELDPDLVASALGELVANALQAGATRVWVRAALDAGEGMSEFGRGSAQTAGRNRRLRMVVSDDGRGISPHARRHAFDPFFSEREAGRGRGLGLARARHVVESLGGSIGLGERAGGGTEAWIEFAQVAGVSPLKESA